MSLESIPDDEQLLANGLVQCPQELDDLRAFDRAGEEPKVLTIEGDPSDRRELMPIEVVLKDGCSAFRRPGVIAKVKLTHPRRSNFAPLGEDGGFFRAVEMLTQEQAVEIKVLLRFTEMGDTFPIPTCQSGWHSHQRGDQMGTRRDLKALEQRRLRGARLLKRGYTQAEVARMCEVSRQAVSLWAQALEAGGEAALRNKRLGRPPSLETDQRAELVQLLKAGALAQGFATELWTLKLVGELIARRFGVRDSHTQVGRLTFRRRQIDPRTGSQIPIAPPSTHAPPSSISP
jgi:transposase